MRRFIGITAVAAALSMLACETSETQRREGRTPARYNDTTTRPVENRPPPGEYRPNDNSPMRGDESFPAEYPGTSTGGLGSAVGGSADTAVGSGSAIDRSSSTPPASGTTGETGTGTTNSDRLSSGSGLQGTTGSGTTGTGSTGSTGSENRYQDPSKHTEGSATSSTGTGTSTGSSSLDRSDSTGNTGSGSKRLQGRTGTQDRSTRPRVGAPPASDPLGNTNSDSPDVSGTPPIPSGDQTSSNPYDLGAAKSPKSPDAGMGGADGGMKLEGNLPSDTRNTY